MINRTSTRQSAQDSFWNSKLGHAAIASIAAMVMLIALSSQIQPSPANASPLAHPPAAAGVMIEIA